MSTLELFDRATALYATHLAAVGDRWSAGTPCDDWDVRALTNHVAGEVLWMPDLFAGKTVAEVGDKFDGDLLGDDPVATFDRAVSEAKAVLSAPGALEKTVHLSFGDFSGADYTDQISSDLTIHAWDLARAIGGDESLDPELVALTDKTFGSVFDAFRGPGGFGDDVPVPDDADAQTKLLAKSGRKP